MAVPLSSISHIRVDPVVASIRSTLDRLHSQFAPTTSYLSGSLLASLDAVSSRLPSSQTLEQEARKHLAATLSLARAAGAHSSDVLSAARRRETGYSRVVEKWYPAAIEGWATFEDKVFLLSNGALEGTLLRSIVAALALLLFSLALVTAKSRRSASSSIKGQPSVISALSQTESSTSGADSSYTSEDDSDEDPSHRASAAAFRRSTSPLGRSGQSPAGRASRHFAVGSASKRADKRSSIIRITSSDPSSSLCHMPVELDLLSPTSSSSAQRSSSPSQAAALAVLKRRRKRMGIRVITSDLTPLGDELAAILAKDSDTAEEGGDSPQLARFAQELDASTDVQRGASPLEDDAGHLSASGSVVRAPSPLKKVAKNRPPMRIKRSPSPLPPDAPEPIPERNSSYHKLNGVVQAIKPRVVGGDRTDAPPSILRKKSQVWSDRGAEEEAAAATMSRNGSRASAKQDINEGASGQASPTSANRTGPRPSSGSNVEAWRSSTLIVGPRSLQLPEDKIKTLRAIKLTEPDWAPYVTIHERARERVEKKREKDAAKKKVLLQAASAGSTKKAPLTSPTGSVKRKESIRRRKEELRLRALGEEEDDTGVGGELAYFANNHSPSIEDEHSHEVARSASRGADGSRGSGSGSTTPRRRGSNGSQHRTSRLGMSVLSPSPSSQGVNRSNEPDDARGAPADADAESDFWFERYIPSTAAAGKDWDWRKRRARVRAEAEALRNTSFVESLRAKVDEDGDESYTMDFDGLEVPEDDGNLHSNAAAGSGGGSIPTASAGGSGQYVINGHVFSHGLVGASLGYTPSGGGSRASPSGISPRDSPVGGPRERRR